MDRDDLIRSITNRNLVVVTGAGFSQFASGNPIIDGHRVASWRGLLGHGYQYCLKNGLHGSESTHDVELQLEEGETRQLIGAAQTILGWLDGSTLGHRAKWLTSSIGQLRLTQPDFARALKSISPILATLNYDDLLEQGTSYPSLDWTQANSIASVFRKETEPHVIHLHGFWKNPSSVIASFFSYRDITKDSLTRALMNNLFMYHRLLFVGCRGTFQDPHFADVLTQLTDSYAGDYHYVLCRDADEAGLQNVIRHSNILRPITYGTSYEDIIVFIETLARESNTLIEEKARTLPGPDDRRRSPSLRFKTPSEIWKMRSSE